MERESNFITGMGVARGSMKEATTCLQRECATRGQRIADLERLLIRAADALEKEFGHVKTPIREPWILIAELRKAAQ